MSVLSGRDESSRDGWRVLALIVVSLSITAWIRPLMTPDEGRYASVAWSMLSSGDWWTPTLNGLPFFHKPPLFYWITAAALRICGNLELAARVASLAGATLGAFSLYLFTRRWSSAGLARRVLVVLLVQPMFLLGAQFANLDMLVAGCIVATVLALAHVALLREEEGAADPSSPLAMLLLAYALAALGVLAKGLIGFVLPAMIIGLWLMIRRRWASLLYLFSLRGALLFLVMAAPWFIVMQMRFDGFLHYFFVVQHFQRFAAGGFNNVQPFWFYPVALFACSIPCIFWARRVFAQGYFADGTRQASLRLLMALAAGCILLFFSLPQSKLIGYILPAVPPLAWLMADASCAVQESSVRQRGWIATLVVSALLGVAVVAALAIHDSYSMRALGVALGTARQQGEPVYMVDGYQYDVPFYARLGDPVIVVDKWSDPRIQQRDNWRKELADAAEFNQTLAGKILLEPQDLPKALCNAPVAWVLGAANQDGPFTFLMQADAVKTFHGKTLWRVEPRKLAALNCQGMPNVGSADK